MRAPERLGPYVYRQSDTCFPLGGDSLALAAFASCFAMICQGFLAFSCIFI